MTPHGNHKVEIGVLLAGGSGRRAGVDKRFLVLGGRTLLLRNLAFLRSAFPTVAVSLGAGQQLDLGDAGGVEIVHDAWPGASPLAGIASALARHRRPVFALAVDIAFPDSAAPARVLAAFPGHDLVLPAIGREYHQPLFAVYGPACLAPMTALLEAGRHRIVEILPALDAAEVRFPDDALFHNINTMDDYQAARRHAAAGSGAQPALVAIVGKSDSGKTTLIEKVVPELVKLGLRVGTVKHDAHSFEIDHPGKDSWRHGQAGAHAYAIASPERLAFITKLDGEMPLADIARRFFAGFDLVVAEGYKRTAPHRVELFRIGAGHAEPLCGPGEAMALVTDAELTHEHRFELEDGAGLARFLAVRLDSLRDY
jgi:molybdopterin-guanine dinucleotide biosynthesis protein B/molybdopterin-guanine dinucleotide biosynthesis protein